MSLFCIKANSGNIHMISIKRGPKQSVFEENLKNTCQLVVLASNLLKKKKKPEKRLKPLKNSKIHSRKNLFRFFSIFTFSGVHPKFLHQGSTYLYFFFFCLKEHVKMQGMMESVFQFTLNFYYRYKNFY